MENKIIITGGLGFICTNLCQYLLDNTDFDIYIADKMTYAANDYWLTHKNNRIHVNIIDINDNCFADYVMHVHPKYIINAAAESHVDQSLESPIKFVASNVLGTANVLEAVRKYHMSLNDNEKAEFRLSHMSTDEVFGDLPVNKGFFTEKSPIKPSSPYSASKASSDLLVKAWCKSFGIPAIITNCSNNYGKFQHREKLIPHTIECAVKNQTIGIYGTGLNERNWIHAIDHCNGVWTALTKGMIGETYLIGSDVIMNNVTIVNKICEILDEHHPKKSGSYKDQIKFITDRKGHDLRYAVDYSKMKNELNWKPEIDFDAGLKECVLFFAEKFSKEK